MKFVELQQKIWYWLKKKMNIYSWKSYKENFKRKIERRIFKNRYSTDDIISLMRTMGLRKGSTVFIHSAWDEFYNYNGTIKEFIDAILEELGEEGTLAMPAYPLLSSPDSIFDVKRTRTAAGMIAETFRNYPNVKRSKDRLNSVCAIGPMADYLLNEHQYSITCWDEKSPFYKLSKINALIFSFGLGKGFIGASVHCVESLLREEFLYFSLFFQKKKTFKIKLEDGTIYNQECLVSSDNFNRYSTDSSQDKLVKKYFDKSKYKKMKLSNLTVNIYDAQYLVNRLIELSRKRIVIYLRPSPLKKYFVGN
jgi:aminoglycoside 3-N-acetyltransferase